MISVQATVHFIQLHLFVIARWQRRRRSIINVGSTELSYRLTDLFIYLFSVCKGQKAGGFRGGGAGADDDVAGRRLNGAGQHLCHQICLPISAAATKSWCHHVNQGRGTHFFFTILIDCVPLSRDSAEKDFKIKALGIRVKIITRGKKTCVFVNFDFVWFVSFSVCVCEWGVGRSISHTEEMGQSEPGCQRSDGF